jgi:phosphatidylinositol glycan class T
MDPFKNSNKRDFNLKSLFRLQKLSLTACPLATRSTVFISKAFPENAYQIQTNAVPITLPPNQSRGLFMYTLNKNFDLNVSFSKEHNNVNFAELTSQADVIVHRYVTGYGQQKGGLVVHFENRHPNTDLLVTYYQSIPWFVRLYFHTLRVVSNHKTVAPNQIFHYERVVPAEDRISPSIIELEFWLGANTTMNVAIDFDKAFLHYTEHPPDANRGFDISSAIMTVHFNSTLFSENTSRRQRPIYYCGLEWSPLTYPNLRGVSTTPHKVTETNIFPVRIYTEGILMSLPTPDFSMPYNVITLTCTVFALYFGTMFNIVTRNFKEIYKDNEFISNRPIVRIFRKLYSVWKSFEKRSVPPTTNTTMITATKITPSSDSTDISKQYAK